jgi:hypothetical protein
MRGAILYGPRDVRFEERAEPTIIEPTDAINRFLLRLRQHLSSLGRYRRRNRLDAGEGERINWVLREGDKLSKARPLLPFRVSRPEDRNGDGATGRKTGSHRTMTHLVCGICLDTGSSAQSATPSPLRITRHPRPARPLFAVS